MRGYVLKEWLFVNCFIRSIIFRRCMSNAKLCEDLLDQFHTCVWQECTRARFFSTIEEAAQLTNERFEAYYESIKGKRDEFMRLGESFLVFCRMVNVEDVLLAYNVFVRTAIAEKHLAENIQANLELV